MVTNHTLRSLAGRLGAYTVHSRYDVRELTAPARAAFLDRFYREVDPDGTLPQRERARRVRPAAGAGAPETAYPPPAPYTWAAAR